MKQTFLTIITILSSFLAANCQQLLPALETFSSKKECYLITKKGERIDFILKDLDRKKGLIINVEGKTKDGKKFEYKAEEIEQLALAPSDFAKFSALSNATESVLTASKTDVGSYNRELVYFFLEYITERKTFALMQRLNPEFDSKLRIYHDPWASETAGISVGGIQVTGGIDKSYFVKTDGKVTRIFKKDYDDNFKKYFGNCPELNAKYKDPAWRDFPNHVFFFDKSCK